MSIIVRHPHTYQKILYCKGKSHKYCCLSKIQDTIKYCSIHYTFFFCGQTTFHCFHCPFSHTAIISYLTYLDWFFIYTSHIYVYFCWYNYSSIDIFFFKHVSHAVFFTTCPKDASVFILCMAYLTFHACIYLMQITEIQIHQFYLASYLMPFDKKNPHHAVWNGVH